MYIELITCTYLYVMDVVAVFNAQLIEIEFETRQEKEAFIKWVLEPSMPSEERKCLSQIREKAKTVQMLQNQSVQIFQTKNERK